MGHTDSTRYPALQEALSCYWLPGLADQPLREIAERIKADSTPEELAAIRRDIAEFLRFRNDELDEAFEQEFVSYYWPAGDGLTARQWLMQLDAVLEKPLDTSRDHRSGAW